MEKSNVVKSKSSNSAITTKSDNHSNKKSRSNGEFQRNVVKKRGVYVEKKTTDINIHNKGNLQDKAVSKAPPRPKPGQKRFLASVLTILSKSTAATQFPENVAEPKKVKRKVDNNRRSANVNKKKYRSKILNNEMFENLDEQKSLVLQYKNINNTASNYSETDSIKYRDVFSPVSNRSNLLRSDKLSVMSSEAKGVVKQVLEGLQAKKKDARIQEPVTQVEKVNATETGENDEQLYKFFVDLLETTFSVYNVKADYDAAPNIESAYSSKVAFEIDESVVKKLDTRKLKDDEERQKQSNYYYVNDSDVLGNNIVPETHKRSNEPKEVMSPKPSHPKRRIKTQSFVYNTKPKNIFDMNVDPFIFSKKSVSKKAKKKTLINLFKEQLKMTYSDYEEPQTLYEALRVMARNKRKNQKAIRFDVPSTKECFFRRPRIISAKKPKKNMKYDNEYSPYEHMKASKSYVKSDAISRPVEKDSYQTLEVYGYDYEMNHNHQAYSAEKETILQSFASDDEFDFDNFEPFDNYVDTRDKIDMFDEIRR